MRTGAGCLLLAVMAACGLRAGAADRISYYKNGQIHVGVPGEPDGKPLTTGHWDFKPSWSKTGNHLVFFRRLKDDPDVLKWISAICIIDADGTGFHPLTDGTHTDFNPTWTRDGSNTPLWNRKNPEKGSFYVMQGKIGGKPGEEAAVTDAAYHTWVYSTLADGRLLVSCLHPAQGWGYYLMTRKPGGTSLYERIDCELAKKGLLERASVSPDETKVCVEFMTGFKFKEPGHAIYVADFDAAKRAITGLKAIANEDQKPFWYAYPRWIEGGSAVVYHANRTGMGEMFRYTLKDGATARVSTDAGADYRYPHGEAAPN